MDSLTQIVLGAAVGEMIAGKKLGYKAMVWGGIAGTIPDLDILVNPWLDMVQQLSFHRSITHSFLFAFVASPILGYLMWRIYRNEKATYIQWILIFFLGFTTHAILDSFTTWGTQLFWPFSRYGIAFYNIFVIDPFYTIPFMICLLAAAFYSRKSTTRRVLNYTGIGISSAYILFSFYAKSQADQAFETNMKEQGISYSSFISKPTPFNTLLWSVTAETNDGFYTGFYSLFDKDNTIHFVNEPKNHDLLKSYRGNDKLERLLEITKGYYTVSKTHQGVFINDLRFGQFDGWQKGEGRYVFVYHVKPVGNELEFEEINYRPKPDAAYFRRFLNRIMGNN
jgi:inner membrane protein